MTTSTGYARPELLAETEWLADHLEDSNVRVVDCATQDAYRRAHIPGAVGLSVNPFIKDADDPVHVMPSDHFARLAAELGISDGTLVVTYDDNNSLSAARFWWVLNYYGHTNAKVLNGGWNKWLSEGRPITLDPLKPAAGSFTPRVDESQVCLVDGLKAKVGGGSASVLDVRSDGEWLGTNSRGNKRVGHVPGASHLEWLDFVTKDDHRTFKPAAEIRNLLSGAGVSSGPNDDIVTYCQGGIRAAHAAFVLRLMGFNAVRNYDGSMREWANRDDTPLVVEG
jgi:thiosulfate/3-mercaptopyruvate sulfurtransferase